MRRLTQRDDRGVATLAVIVLMPLIFALAAIAIDGGGLIMERRSAQHSADAAALGVARSCVQDATPSLALGPYINGNSPTNQTASITAGSCASRSITVKVD